MASTSNLASCISSNGDTAGGLSPVNPFCALRYQFGMLLGVDDFETEQAYHRGKSRLHNSWLHRAGVVWGMEVLLDAQRNEIKVNPGLALDAAGHELHLDAHACVDVTKWYDTHKNDADFKGDPGLKPTPTGVQFDAHVVIAFQACLTRQVPAMLEPCQNSVTDTTYSRVFETVKLSLLPGKAVISPKPYHRLRLLFGIEQPAGDGPTTSEQEVLDALADILTKALPDQPAAYLAEFRKFAALDEIDLRPATAPDGSSLLLFPAADDTCVLLANIEDITLDNTSGVIALTGGLVDQSVRPSHVATGTIEELLCGPLFRNNPPAPSTVGPRVTPGSTSIAGRTVTFTTNDDLIAGTVRPQAFSATLLDASGNWKDLGVSDASWTVASKTVTLTLSSAPGTGQFRLIARGTGPTPLFGAKFALGGSSSTADGEDFVWMQEVK